MARTGTTDPLLQKRIASETRRLARLHDGLARRLYLMPFLPVEPVGVLLLSALT